MLRCSRRMRALSRGWGGGRVFDVSCLLRERASVMIEHCSEKMDKKSPAGDEAWVESAEGAG